jgi:hypothetical protein
VVNATLWPLYPREEAQIRIVQEAGWSPGPVWIGMENRIFISSSRVRTPNYPARGERLYRPPFLVGTGDFFSEFKRPGHGAHLMSGLRKRGSVPSPPPPPYIRSWCVKGKIRHYLRCNCYTVAKSSINMGLCSSYLNVERQLRTDGALYSQELTK